MILMWYIVICNKTEFISDLVMEDLMKHLSFPPGVEVTNVLNLLGEMQAALLRKPNGQFDEFIRLVDRKKKEIYLFRQNLSRDVVIRSVCHVLPKELEVCCLLIFPKKPN